MALLESLRHSLFAVVSIATTTGFTTVDYSLWGGFPVAVFFFLTFVGGCTGSTTGGASPRCTTLIAAEKSGRLARLIELDPKYVDVIVRRWQEWAGKQATRESDGALFDDQAASDSSLISQ